MRALEKDPARRYPSASELAADVRRHLDDEPVAAGPPSAAYRLGKIVRRHKGPLAAAAAVLIVLLVGLTTSSILYFREQAARTRAAEQRAEAQWRSYVANIAAADLHLRAGETAMATRRLEACEPELRGWEWRHLWLKSDSSLSRIQVGDDIREVSFSPDQTRIFGLSGDAVLVWDATDGEVLHSFRPERDGETDSGHEFRAIGYQLDGRLLAHASSPVDPSAPFVAFAEHVRVSDRETGEAIAELAIPKSMRWAAFNSDGSRLVTKWHVHDVYSLWDLESGRLVATLGELPDPSAQGWASLGKSRAAMNPDGSRFVFPSIDGYVRTVDVVSGQLLGQWKADHVPRIIEFHPQGRTVASGDLDALRIWNPINGDDVKIIPRVGVPSGIAWSRDGKRVACGVRNGRIRVVDIESEKVVDTLMGHDGEVTSLAFSADGKRIVTAGKDGTIRIWDAESRRSPVRIGRATSIQAKGADGRWILARLENATAVWDPDSGDLVSTLEEKEHRTILQAWGFDFETKRMGLVRGGERYQSRGINVEKTVEPVSLETWDMESGVKIATMEGSHAKTHAVVLGPDGAWLAAGSEDGVRLWDADTGASIAALRTGSAPSALAASPDGKTLAVGYWNGSAEVLDRATLDAVVTLESDESQLVAITFSPDGRRILLAAGDRLRVADATTGRTLATLDEKDVSSVAHSPDGRRIVTGSGTAGRLRVWDAERFELLLTLEIEGGVREAVFSPDGNRIVAISSDGTTRIWQTDR
jgi:WD40 repeat protein